MITKDYLKKLAGIGYSIIPCDATKKPQELKWTEQQCKTADEIDRMNAPLYGCRAGFNDIECIDVDLKVLPSLPDRQKWWDEYISFLSDNISDFFEKVVIAKTMKDGYHIIYKCTSQSGNTKIAKLKGMREAIIESRGKGGQFILYGNFFGKNEYHDIKYITEEEREIIWSISRTYNYVEEVKLDKPTVKQYKVNADELSPWDDYNAQINTMDLISDEFTIVRNTSNNYIIRRHGATSPHSGYVYKDSGCMYLFSTGTQYPAEKLLSPFAIYAHKFHFGDFKVAANFLYQKGFGTRRVPKIEIEDKPKVDIDKLTFPIDIFPENIQLYILESAKTLGLSIDYMGCSFIWLLSVIVGNSLKLEVKTGWIENANVWISLVGKAGIGKTPSINQMIRPLEVINNTHIRRYIKEYAKWVEYEKKDKKEREHSEEVRKPKKTQFIVNDITLEALVDLHEENKNAVGVFKDELAGWFKDMNKYRAGSDLEFWLSCWSGKAVSMNRKTAKSSFVDKPHIPVLGGIQPSIFDQFNTEENKENGFTDRMLISFPDLYVDQYSENEMDDKIVWWYDQYIVKFFDKVKREWVKFNQEDDIEPIKAILSPNAKKEWIRIFNKITEMQNSDAENEYMKSMLPKQKSYIPRFALLINAIWSYDVEVNGGSYSMIGPDAMLKAEKLSDYFINMSKKVKIDAQDKKDMRSIMQSDNSKNKYDKFKSLYKANKDMNRTQVAELMNVSRVTLNKWINKIDNETN
jgi:hypothetical protein